MRRIFKYPLAAADEQTVALPAGADILTVQEQNGDPFLWALVDDTHDPEPRLIYTHGTGHHVARRGLRYIGTYQLYGGSFVGHVFEASPA